MQGLVQYVHEQKGLPERKKLGGTIKTAEQQKGVAVFWVAGGGVLDNMGVKIGDTIRGVNGFPCNSANEFFQLVGYSDPTKLQLEILRGSEKLNLPQPPTSN